MAKAGSPISPALAAAIKRHRERQGLSLSKLAELAGVHQTYPGLVERQRILPTVEKADAIAKALGVPLWKLIKEAQSS